MGKYIERYLAGEHQAVWDQLVALGEAALQPPILADATAVADEIVRRIVHNAQIVGQYLADAGYEFETPGPFVVPADANTAHAVQQIEREYGELPLILTTWWSNVDHLNHLPSEQQWTSGRGCPTEGISPTGGIVINSPSQCLEDSREWSHLLREHWNALLTAGESTEGQADPNDVFLLLGPVTSGNDRLVYRLPIRAVDAHCHGDEPPETLVDWLRYAYLTKGGLSWIFQGMVPTPNGEREFTTFIRPEEEVKSIVLSMQLIPF